MTKFQIKKATQSGASLRLAICGPSGSGKTMSGLRVGHGLGTRIGVIDTERGSASKYGDRCPFDVVELDEATIENDVGAMRAFADAGHDVLIVDSMSYAWEWLLDHVEMLGRTKYEGNKWSAWGEAAPMQQRLVDALLLDPGHVMATMRSRTEWVTEANAQGKSQPRRVGTAPRQREAWRACGIERIEATAPPDEARLEREAGYFEALLGAYLEDPVRDGHRTKTLELPGGTVRLRKARPRLRTDAEGAHPFDRDRQENRDEAELPS